MCIPFAVLWRWNTNLSSDINLTGLGVLPPNIPSHVEVVKPPRIKRNAASRGALSISDQQERTHE